MPRYLQNKRAEKEQLENQIGDLKMERQRFEKEKLDLEEKFISTKNKIAIKFDELDWCINVRTDLEKEGIPVEDISLLSGFISKIKRYRSNNLDTFQIIKRIKNIENLEKEIEIKKRRCSLLKTDIEVIEEHGSKLVEDVNSKILKLDSLNEIEKMGFTFTELKKLNLRLTEIGVANNMNPHEIKEQFFESLSQYAYKITAQKELERLNKSITEVEKLLHKKRSNLAYQGMAEKIVQDLVDKGMDESDIILFNEFIEIVDGYRLKPKELVEFVKWMRVQYRVVTKMILLIMKI